MDNVSQCLTMSHKEAVEVSASLMWSWCRLQTEIVTSWAKEAKELRKACCQAWIQPMPTTVSIRSIWSIFNWAKGVVEGLFWRGLAQLRLLQENRMLDSAWCFVLHDKSMFFGRIVLPVVPLVGFLLGLPEILWAVACGSGQCKLRQAWDQVGNCGNRWNVWICLG